MGRLVPVFFLEPFFSLIPLEEAIGWVVKRTKKKKRAVQQSLTMFSCVSAPKDLETKNEKNIAGSLVHRDLSSVYPPS